MGNKKEPLMSAEEYYNSIKIRNKGFTTYEWMEKYANYVTEWHLNNAKEFVADEAELVGKKVGEFVNIYIDKQSIHTAIDNYIEINLNK